MKNLGRRAKAGLTMPRLYMITVPGLEVTADWRAVQDRLLDDFPEVTDVLATTLPETLLIVYEGEVNVDGWLAGVSDGILSRRMLAATTRAGTSQPMPRRKRPAAVPHRDPVRTGPPGPTAGRRAL